VISSKSEKFRLLGTSARRSDADCTLEFGDCNSGDADAAARSGDDDEITAG